MKQLILVRHAKSDWDDPSVADFDRPLNGRGKKDAPAMAQRLLDKKIRIDAFISSPAKRAKKTATIFAEVYKRDKEEIILNSSLYEASVSVFYDVTNTISGKFETVAIFSHNPGISEFANLLTDARIDNIPTCGVFAIKADVDTWQGFREARKEFWFFDYPKAE